MFGAAVPAASNNTTLEQLLTQAARRQCMVGGLWDGGTAEWMLTLLPKNRVEFRGIE